MARSGAEATRAPATKASAVATPVSRPKRIRAAAPAMKSSMLHIRLDDALKDEAIRTLDQIGISLPEAIRVFLKRIVREQAFPFRLEVPNPETAAALRDSMATTPRAFGSAREMFDALDEGGER